MHESLLRLLKTSFSAVSNRDWKIRLDEDSSLVCLVSIAQIKSNILIGNITPSVNKHYVISLYFRNTDG